MANIHKIRNSKSDTRPRCFYLRSKTAGACATGFTLVELLVVIAIIALLLSILSPSLMKARSLAKRLECTHNLRQIYIAVNLYLNTNDNIYPCAQDPVDPDYWLWMGRGWRHLVEPYLGGNIDVNNPSVLLCTADLTEKEKYESTSYGYSMAFYHSPEQIDDMNSIEDTCSNSKLQHSIPQKSFNVATPSGKILIAEWFSNHEPIEPIEDDREWRNQGWWTWDGSRNYLFADGQVMFLKTRQIRPARNNLPDANLTIHGIKGTDLPR